MPKVLIQMNHTSSNRYYITHKCQDCGKTVFTDDKFCSSCGSDVVEVIDGGEQEIHQEVTVRPDGPETDRGGLIGQGGY